MAVSSLSLAVFAVFSISAVAQTPLAPVGTQADPARAVSSLPPVIVTATRFVDDANTLPFGVRVITADDLRRAGVDTVNQALMKLLGVPGRQDFFGGGDYALDLRGFGSTADSNQVIVVDGIRLNEADSGGTRLAGIPIDSVERIEVVRGSGSVLYGEGAAAGVIVITTHAGSGAARANAAQLTAGAGSFGKRELRGAASLAAGDFSLDVAANRQRADNHRDNFRSDVSGASLAGQWHNEWLRLGLGHAQDDLDTGLPGALSAPQYASNPRQTRFPDDKTSIGNRRNTLFAQATLGDWQLAFDAGSRAKSLSSLNAGSAYDYEVDARSQSLRARHVARFGDIGNALVLGLDHGQWTRTVPGGSGSVSRQQSRATYVRDEITLAGGTRLSAGWRSEAVRKSNTTASTGVDERQNAWELGVLQPVAAGASVYARVGKSFRLPNVDEFGFTSPNASLHAQTSRDAELGARWAGGGSRVEARLYRSSFNDEIGFDPSAPGPFGPGANVNYDPTRRQGLEIELSQALADSFTLHVNAAARQASFRAGAHTGRDVPLTPRHTLSLRGEWQPAPQQQIDVLLNQVASQHPDFDNVCRMPAYATLDLRYAYRWQSAEVALGIANLGGRKYYTQAFGCTAGQVNAIYPEAGRAISASLRLAF
jgi:iron complex outermembrane recepter protein